MAVTFGQAALVSSELPEKIAEHSGHRAAAAQRGPDERKWPRTIARSTRNGLRLKQAVAASAEQQKNERLTGAQDLAWALINSPAFLFNR